MPRAETILQIEEWCPPVRAGFVFTISDIKEKVKQVLDISEEDLLSYKKQPRYTEARFCYAWFCKRLTYKTDKAIGEEVGRIPSAILHAYWRAEGLLDVNDSQFASKIINVFTLLKEDYERLQDTIAI